MPAESLIAAKHRTLLALVLSALGVATPGSVIAAFSAHRLTAPLNNLTQAAHEVGRGDLKAAIPFPDRPVEIAALAAAPDDSRIRIRRTMEELSRVKTWSETLIQPMTEGVVTFDANRRVTFFSRGAARITDWTGAEAAAQPIAQVLNLPDSEISQILASVGVKRQLQSMTRSGQRKILAVTSATAIPPGSDTNQTLLVLRDITDEEMGQRLHSNFLGNILVMAHPENQAAIAVLQAILGERIVPVQGSGDEIKAMLHLVWAGESDPAAARVLAGGHRLTWWRWRTSPRGRCQPKPPTWMPTEAV